MSSIEPTIDALPLEASARSGRLSVPATAGASPVDDSQTADTTNTKGRIYTRLLLIGIPAIVIVNLLISCLLAVLQYREQLSELQEKQNVLLSTEARVLGSDLAHFRSESVAIHLAQIVTDPDIVEAVVHDAGGLEVAQAFGHEATGNIETQSAPITYMAQEIDAGIETIRPAQMRGRLDVTFTTQHVTDRFWRQTLAGLTGAAFSSAVLIVFIGWLTRKIIGEPLKRLTNAFEASQRDGRRHRVDWASNDEFGRVAAAFNRMQGWLDRVDIDRQAFQDRLERFYHGTPVMLHSVDENGVLLQVSTHWCNETGYRREEVLGSPLTRFLTPVSAKLYKEKILPDYLLSGVTDETPLQFVCRDGRVMDVLLAETRESHTNESGSPSLSVMTDISKIKLAERELERLVATDSVTGLFNRRGFLMELEKAISTGRKATIAFVDLDRFKRINDTYGHPAGDQLLMTISARLNEIVAWGGFAGRLGGDEFALFVPDTSDLDQSEALATATLRALRRPVALANAVIEPSGSVGFARFPQDGETSAEIIIAADLALYRAKHGGRDRVDRFDERLRHELAERREQEDDIRDGLANDWFKMHIQPIVRLSDGCNVGGEALARLAHPVKGLLSPAHFVKTAEESGSIDAIGRSMLRQALSVIPELIEATGNSDFYLSINLSGGQVRDDLPTFLSGLMREFGVNSSNIVLEIIETALFDDAEKANEILSALSRLGIRFALDDFGTGFSSLNYVQQFPVSMIKIDRSYTRCLRGTSGADRRISALVRTCVTLGNELGLPIVAEGIELMEELEGTRALGIELGQGFLFSPALKVPSFIELVTAAAGTGAPRAFRLAEGLRGSG